ncbi:MAG: hypothetical protein ACR2PL_26155 [Dehalococcoidia bacterium]
MNNEEARTADATGPEVDEEAEASDRRVNYSRRALLRAGWAAPVILVSGSGEVAAQTHSDRHGDCTGHYDFHSDVDAPKK